MKRIRPGKSLLEAVVMISMLAIVVGMSATSLATLFRLRRQFSRDAEQAQALDRLASRLRSDAHEAVSASVETGLVLTLADGRTIEYSHVSPSLVRQVKRDGAVVHHDTFLLPRNASVAFGKDDQSDHPLIRLTIGPGEFRLPARELPRAATIEAIVGLSDGLVQIAREP